MLRGKNIPERVDLVIDAKIVERKNFWSLYNATSHTASEAEPKQVSFLTEPSTCPRFLNQTSLEKLVKNIETLDNDQYIVKCITAWKNEFQFNVLLERVTPLSDVINTLTTTQICLGLKNILNALLIIHETFDSILNNLTTKSIYVTADGTWKLGAIEYMCPIEDLSNEYIKELWKFVFKDCDYFTKNYLQHKAYLTYGTHDILGFFAIVQEVLLSRANECFPNLQPFITYCKKKLENPVIGKMCDLHQLLQNKFFNNNLVLMYTSFKDLNLMSETDKIKLFATICIKLRHYPSELIASQLQDVLLCPQIFLDPVVQKYLLPKLLVTEQLFSKAVFQQFVVPKLIQMLKIQNNELKLIILMYFKSFMLCCSPHQLEFEVLKQLKSDLRHSSNEVTVRIFMALADLVPLLGGQVVAQHILA